MKLIFGKDLENIMRLKSIIILNIPTTTSFSFKLDNVLGSNTQLVYNLNVSSGIETHCFVTSSLLKRRTTSFSLYSGTTA